MGWKPVSGPDKGAKAGKGSPAPKTLPAAPVTPTVSRRALSPREREVAELATAGLSSRVIAKRLSLSTRTVDNHLGRAYAKLGVANRTALAAVINTRGPH
jgi:DNA-binding NarL/FixJ family response regulator